MFSYEFLERVAASDKAGTCLNCGVSTNNKEFYGTECDGLYVQRCSDWRACKARREARDD